MAMFNSALGAGAFGGAAATASVGSGSSGASNGSALSPGGVMSGSGGTNPFLPNHPAGIAFYVGVGSVILLVALWYSLPS